MKLLRCTLFLPFLPAVVMAWAVDPPAGQADLDRQVRELERQIEKVRELKFKKPVVARLIARAKDGAPGVQGYYDPKKKQLFVYDDIKPSYRKGTLVHEMVHALQDQHFGLAKLHQATFDSDRELALAALIEGDATLTMIRLLQKEQPHVTRMLATDLAKARNLQNAFLYGQGARFVEALHKRGGWKAVNQRYRFPPTSTAVILHPGERITPVELGPGRRVGAFGLLRLLHGNPATRAESVTAAAGWRGDRVLADDDGRAWVVAFATHDQAQRFHQALVKLQQAEYPKQESLTDAAGVRVWGKEHGGRRGVLLRGNRVWEIDSHDESGYRRLLDRLEGPPRLTIWSAREKKTLTFGELIDRLLGGDMICVGETHDSELHHTVQLMVVKALFARDERLGVGMEMFQRPFQKHLDRHLAGAIDEATFLEDTEYQKRWGYDWALYRPIVEFCRRNRVSVAALNLPDELRRRLSQVGHEKLTAEEKKALGEVDFQVKEHRAHWFDRLGEMHGHGQGQMSKESKEKFYQVMTAWDEYMADSAARFQKERKLRRLVVLAGSGHIERGFGIPRRAEKRTGGKVLSVTIRVGGDLARVAKEAAADFVVMVQ